MRKIVFSNSALKMLIDWSETDKKIHRKICTLILETTREPFLGIGKPEPLKGELSGFWSRRINDEHRLVYKVTEDAIEVISCKYHY
jgi:toxin YoeB